MKELSKRYGKEIPFEDDLFIDEIVAMTYPEVRTFFDDHVIGNAPIDYGRYLAKVGLAMVKMERQTGYFLDGENPFIDVDIEDENTIFIRENIPLSSFYKNIGLQAGDIIKSINGTDISLESLRSIIASSYSWSPETEIKIELLRQEEVIIVEGAVGLPVLLENKIVILEGVSNDFFELRNAWLRQ
jgi:C-terminal processing protease CtpA/Prc